MPDLSEFESAFSSKTGEFIFHSESREPVYLADAYSLVEALPARYEFEESVGAAYWHGLRIQKAPRWPLGEAPESQPLRKSAPDSHTDYGRLLQRLDLLASQLTELREEVGRLSERAVYSTTLTALASPDYELLRDIPITVERDEDETVVSWFEDRPHGRG